VGKSLAVGGNFGFRIVIFEAINLKAESISGVARIVVDVEGSNNVVTGGVGADKNGDLAFFEGEGRAKSFELRARAKLRKVRIKLRKSIGGRFGSYSGRG